MNRRACNSERPVTETGDGQEVIHKYKFQYLCSLHSVKVEPYEDEPPLKNGFVVYLPQRRIIYQAPSSKERRM
jgi:hypothetical protein